jgi:hypothetical protein
MPLFLLLVFAAAACAQPGRDTVLFSVPLPAPVLGGTGMCAPNNKLHETVTGPIVMAGTSLLIYTATGYVLYDTTGAVADSHTVGAAKNGGVTTRLAFPLDCVTLLYTRTGFSSGRAVRVYRKRLGRPELAEIDSREYGVLGRASTGPFVNIACNSSTPARPARLTLEPFLVGFGAIDGGARWWWLGGQPRLEEPVVYRGTGGDWGLFPGLLVVEGVKLPRKRALELRGGFPAGQGQAYLGVERPAQSDAEEGRQVVYRCDHAGNLLSADTIFAYRMVERMVELFSKDGENMMGFVRDIGAFGSAPVPDAVGRVYYGVFDPAACSLSVHRMEYPAYRCREAPAQKKAVFAGEESITFAPLELPCASAQRPGTEIPRVFLAGSGGARRPAGARELTRNGYLVRIGREPLRDLSARLARPAPALAPAAKHLLDSLVALPGIACPWVLSLSGPSGFVRTFAYGPAERVACARVLGVVPPGKNVAVRVDLMGYAEIVLFEPDGTFVNRCVFNRQPIAERRDVIAVRSDGALIERDHEGGRKKPSCLLWEPAL